MTTPTGLRQCPYDFTVVPLVNARCHLQLWPTDFGPGRHALLTSEGVEATEGKSLP
jgi:hypothetical protein